MDMLRSAGKPLLVGIGALVAITVMFSLLLDRCSPNNSNDSTATGNTLPTAIGDQTAPAPPVPDISTSNVAVLGTQIDGRADQRAAERLVLSSGDLTGEARVVEPFITSTAASLEVAVATCMGQPAPETQRSAKAEGTTWGTDDTNFSSTVEVWIDPKLALDEVARRDSKQFRSCVKDAFAEFLTTQGRRGVIYNVAEVETREFPLDQSGPNGTGFEITMLLNDGLDQELWYLQRHTLVEGRTITTVWAAEEFRPPRTQLVEQALTAARDKLVAGAVQ